MARPRSNPPGTPFGAWLVGWFERHPDVTMDAFGTDVGVSKSAVSLWVSAQRPVQIKAATLRSIAKRTGEPLENLEQLVYGVRGERSSGGGDDMVTLSRDELEQMLTRAAERAIRLVLAEGHDG